MTLRSTVRLVPALLFGWHCCGSSAQAACPTGEPERVLASSVNDRGEILLSDGRVARLAGLDIPDPGRGDPKIAANARSWLAARLAGREIGLRVFSPKPDRWGRILADISAPQDGAASGNSLSLSLLSAGLARVRPELETRGCQGERLAAKSAARINGLGVWSDPYYGVVEATDVDELRRRDGQFLIVEGLVQRVGQGRSRTYLDFGRRGSFTIVLSKRQAKALDRTERPIAGMAGVRVRVRGALDNRFGPRMAISEPDDIEQTSQNSGASEAKPGK